MGDHYHHHFLVVVLLLSATITCYDVDAAFYHHDILCPKAPPDGSGDDLFNFFCSPYEFNPAYYPGAQELALKATTCEDDPRQLGKCLDTPYGEATGIQLWMHHYASCYMPVQADCEFCLKDAAKVMRQRCPNRIGARVASRGCCARYEQYHFC